MALDKQADSATQGHSQVAGTGVPDVHRILLGERVSLPSGGKAVLEEAVHLMEDSHAMCVHVAAVNLERLRWSRKKWEGGRGQDDRKERQL